MEIQLLKIVMVVATILLVILQRLKIKELKAEKENIKKDYEKILEMKSLPSIVSVVNNRDLSNPKLVERGELVLFKQEGRYTSDSSCKIYKVLEVTDSGLALRDEEYKTIDVNNFFTYENLTKEKNIFKILL